MALDFQTKARIKTQLAAKGVFWTDNQIEKYWEQLNQTTPTTMQQPAVEAPPTIGGGYDDTTYTEGALDFIGSALWSALDTGTVGLAGLAAKKVVGQEAYEEFERELQDTVGGRVGGTIGGLAGFMAPMGVATKVAGAGFRAAKHGAAAVRAASGGKKIVNPSTKQLQKMAADKIQKETADRLLKSGTKGLTRKEALKIAKETSDDLIGFTQAPVFGSKTLGKIFKRGPAYQMEHSLDFVKNAHNVMKQNMPNRLAAALSKAGVNVQGMGQNRLLKLSDELTDMLAVRPFNQIESMLSGRYSSKIAQGLNDVLASSAQEAITFGMVGTAMDAVQHAKGDLSYEDKSFGERTVDHLIFGGMFGPVKFIPGGRSKGMVDDIKRYAGLNTRKVNKGIDRMTLDETKAFARSTIKNDRNAYLGMDGITITDDLLSARSKFFTTGNLPKLKQALKEHNNSVLSDFRGKFIPEMWKDFYGSIPRMAVGAAVFNYEALNEGHFDHIGPKETGFHYFLGAMMSKAHRPLFRGGAIKSGMHLGERPFYYNSDVRDIYNKMNNLNWGSEHIGKIVKEFDGDLFTDWESNNPVPEIDEIVKVLKENDVAYDVTEAGTMIPDMSKPFSLKDRELMSLLQPIIKPLKVRNIELNPDVTDRNIANAVKAIKNIESSTLSTPESTVMLNNRANIEKAVLRSGRKHWKDLEISVMDNFKNQVETLTGSKNYIGADGKMDEWRLHGVKNLSHEQKAGIGKLEKIRKQLESQDLVRFTDHSLAEGKGTPIQVTAKKADRIISLIDMWEKQTGKDFYGENSNLPTDILDPMMWNQFHMANVDNNVTSVLDVIMDKKVDFIEPGDQQHINSLMHEVLSHESNTVTDIVAEKPSLIGFNLENFTGSTKERLALQEFTNNLWEIAVASGRAPKDPNSHIIDINKVKNLKERLVKAGMPDPELHYLDGRMQTWMDRMTDEALDRTLADLDKNDHKALAIKRLMINGIIGQSTSVRGKGVRLEMPAKISADQIRQIKPNMTEAEVKEYIDSYDRIVSKLGKDVVVPKEDFSAGGWTESQLSAIKTADAIFNIDKFSTDITSFMDNIDTQIIGLDSNIENRLAAIESPDMNPSQAKQVRSLLDAAKEARKEWDMFRLSFSRAFGGDVEITRASAHLEYTKTLRDENGSTVLDYMRGIAKAENISDIQTMSEKVRDLQAEIANKINERPDIQVSFNEKRQEEILRMKHQEVEGMMPKDQQTITPEKFANKYDIALGNINPKSNITYDSFGDAIYNVYKTSKTTKDFADRMFKLAGAKSTNANNTLRSEIAHISGLYERRYNVKKLGVSLDAGFGQFENSEISKGWLTDLYSEAFGPEGGEMIMLSPDYTLNGRINSISRNSKALQSIQNLLYSGDFSAGRKEGFSHSLKYEKEGRTIKPEDGKEYFNGIDIAGEYLKGRHHIVSIDENIKLVIPEANFNKLADNFTRWYERVSDKKTQEGKYVKLARKEIKAADDLFKTLEDYYTALDEIKDSQGYDPNLFKEKFGGRKESISDAMYTMINTMYAEKIDGDWLQDAYLNTLKSYKYKRLAQNQGYTRNSDQKRKLIRDIYIESDNSYHRELVEEFTDKEYENILVIEDGNVSETGEDTNKLITDNRSVTEAQLEILKNDLDKEVYDDMLSTIKESKSLNAEAVNAMTIVRRKDLDYRLLLNGQADLIGKSGGQKPVGLSNYTDSQGINHVFYNKTHYFYHKGLDDFFKENPDISQVAFTSGAKKAKKIDSSGGKLVDKFVPIDPPKMDGKNNLTSFINSLRNINSKHQSVMPVKFNQSLSGVAYGKAKDAKIMKQFENWTSIETQDALYKWSRADMAERFADAVVPLFSSENTAYASSEARSFLRSKSNTDGGISTEVPNASVASIWIEGGGVPFSEISKNLYDSMIKRKYIDDAGVFDGYTDAGGVPVLRGDLDNNLGIPVYSKGKQYKLGEANVGIDYLERKINFRSDFGAPKSYTREGKILRKKYKDSGTASLSFNFKNRDVLVNLKNGEISDPTNSKARITDKEYSNIKQAIDVISKKIKDPAGGIETWKDLWLELNDNHPDAQLAIMAMPAPRTGPHDAMVVKVKKLLDAEDGGIIELNSYDVTMRGQRDYDTDKLPFYMDTPFEALSESYRENGKILEPEPTDNKARPSLDLFDRKSFMEYDTDLNQYKGKRGPVVKMQRKLSYAKRLFNVIDGIDIGNGFKIKMPSDTKEAQQRLVNDSQNVLDIYDGLPRLLQDISAWTRNTLFLNSNNTNAKVDVTNEKPFFHLENNAGDKKAITEAHHEAIVEKLLNDYGNLLNIESNIWEAGEAKTPRYKDMVDSFQGFREEYRSDRVNWNFYNYLKKRGHVDAANELFFDMKPDRKPTEKYSKGMINPIMNKLAREVLEFRSPFLKSLSKIAETDRFRVRETFNPAGDYFNAGIDKLVGKERGFMLETFRNTGFEGVNFDYKNNIINDMWDAFSKNRDHEAMMIQINNIESQIRRAEYNLSNESRKDIVDEARIELESENIRIKQDMLNSMIDKLSIEKDALGQKLIYYKKGKNNIIRPDFKKDIVIRDSKTGERKRIIRPGDENYSLNKREVAVLDPVILKPVVEHELLDGAAFAYSTLGYYSHVKEADLPKFRQIVKSTRSEIKQSISEIMRRKGYRDWREHQSKAMASIDKGLQQIKSLAIDNALNEAGIIEYKGTFMGQLPKGRETYGQDFLMAMLVPDYSGNPNEMHFSPKTGTFLPAVGRPSKSVIQAVMGAMDQYQVALNHKEFTKDFASTHRGFYDALVAGRGFHEGMQRLANTNFEGALLKTTLEKAMNNPYMPRKEYKTMKEYFDSMPTNVDSQVAEIFRSIIQDGAETDPLTAFNLRKKMMETPGLGPDAYNAMFQRSRGQIIFDGLGSKQFGINQGEGQWLGDVLQTRGDVLRRNLIGRVPRKAGSTIKDMIRTTIGYENNKLGEC